MTFRELYLALNDLAGQNAGGDFEELGKTYLNFVYRRLLDLGKVRHESREFELRTIENISKYGLPLYVRRVENVEDTANKKNIYSIAPRSFDLEHPGGDETGTPTKAFPLQTVGVERQPAAASNITLHSSSPLDSGSNYNVILVGFNDDGVLTRESVQVTGITPVSSSRSFRLIERVVKSVARDPFIGDLTIEDDGGNTLAVIPPWWTSPDYFWIEFYPIPESELVYSIRAEMRKPPLVQDTDWPEIEQEYHDLILYGAAADLMPKVGLTDLGVLMKTTFSDRLKEYLKRQQDEFEIPKIATFANIWNSPYGASIRKPRIER